VPLVPCLIFIHTDYQRALSLPAECKITINYMRNLETHKFLVVPDKQMEDFMFLLNFSENTVKVANTNLKHGDKVRVIQGEFTGIEGELIRIRGHKRVVVRLEGLFSLATAYIPCEYLEKI
jgi:transcription antitermination factor NusG